MLTRTLSIAAVLFAVLSTVACDKESAPADANPEAADQEVDADDEPLPATACETASMEDPRRSASNCASCS